MDITRSSLHPSYNNNRLTVTDVVEYVLSRLQDPDQKNVWISTADAGKLKARAALLDSQKDRMHELPLYGLPFSVKDNIDVAGENTTAACPEFSYPADQSATVVQAALNAGAIYIGKTNLDQFATGLVGVRSPYGIPLNPFNADYIPGGSSSGAGVSVSTGIVNFAFGTDTGGSGRVPASYNGIFGLKPAPGLLSRRGLVYACRSIDTATIFASAAADAQAVFDAVSVPDAQDPYYAQHALTTADNTATATQSRIAIPAPEHLNFFQNREVAALYQQAIDRVVEITGGIKTIDFENFTCINDLMFFGPLLAERDVSVGKFVDDNPDACHPVVKSLIRGSREFSAADAYRAQYRIAEAKTATRPLWDEHDILMVPTVGDIYTVEAVLNDPLTLNFNNGYYTNFANPLGLSAVAAPFAKNKHGVPWGVTFLGPAGTENQLLQFAEYFSSI